MTKMLHTKSGDFVVVDITDPTFCPGIPVPIEYEKQGTNGTWFFMPKNWASEADGYGTFVGMFRKFPIVYSYGHATAEEALAAAEEWERTKEDREGRLTGYAAWRAEAQRGTGQM